LNFFKNFRAELQMRKLLVFSCCICIQLLFANNAFALKDKTPAPISEVENSTPQTLDSNQSIILTNNYIHLSNEVHRLEALIQNQNQTISDLKNKLALKSEKVESKIDFPIWTSFLLGASTLITAAIGILVAILSFFGYREIVAKSTDRAEEVATKIATEKIDTETRAKAIQAIKDIITSGLLNPLIDERIAEVTYRGVGDIAPPDEDETDTTHTPKEGV